MFLSLPYFQIVENFLTSLDFYFGFSPKDYTFLSHSLSLKRFSLLCLSLGFFLTSCTRTGKSSCHLNVVCTFSMALFFYLIARTRGSRTGRVRDPAIGTCHLFPSSAFIEYTSRHTLALIILRTRHYSGVSRRLQQQLQLQLPRAFTHSALPRLPVGVTAAALLGSAPSGITLAFACSEENGNGAGPLHRRCAHHRN